MAYSATAIPSHNLDQIKCKICEERFDNIVKMLPCGYSICLNCEEALKLDLVNESTFKCKSCSEVHQMPINGLPLNKFLMVLLKNSFKQLSLSHIEKIEKFRESLNELEIKSEMLKDITIIVKIYESYIFGMFISIVIKW